MRNKDESLEQFYERKKTIYINRYTKIANVMLGSLPHQMTRLVEQLQLVLRMSFLVYMLRSCNFFLMV